MFFLQYEALVGPATRRALSGERVEPDRGREGTRGRAAGASRRPMQKAVAHDTCVVCVFEDGLLITLLSCVLKDECLNECL